MHFFINNFYLNALTHCFSQFVPIYVDDNKWTEIWNKFLQKVIKKDLENIFKFTRQLWNKKAEYEKAKTISISVSEHRLCQNGPEMIHITSKINNKTKMKVTEQTTNDIKCVKKTFQNSVCKIILNDFDKDKG